MIGPGARSGAQAPCDRVSIRYNHHLAELQSPLIYNRLWQTEQNFAGFRFVDFRFFSLFRSARFSYGSSDLEGARFSLISTNVSYTSLISDRKVEEAQSTTATHEGTILEVLWETLTWRVENGALFREVLWATSTWRIEILKKFGLCAADDLACSPDLK